VTARYALIEISNEEHLERGTSRPLRALAGYRAAGKVPLLSASIVSQEPGQARCVTVQD
jgi:hypothetical protein